MRRLESNCYAGWISTALSEASAECIYSDVAQVATVIVLTAQYIVGGARAHVCKR
jgi:hypothetical protein